MGNLAAFLAQNAKQVENVKLVVSDRFTDEDGKPLEWEVRCISSREDETLRRDCQYRVQVPGKRGSFRQEFDNVLYLAKLAAACTVYPNLNDAELQEQLRHEMRRGADLGHADTGRVYELHGKAVRHLRLR